MSADNGIHITKNAEGKYEVRSYWASSEGPGTLLGTFDSLETAIHVGQEQKTEYGLSFSI